MNREVYLENISKNLAILSYQVKSLNTINLYNINIVAEDFYTGLLNLIYGYNLENVNKLDKNAKAIDLVDIENRVSVQVTSENSSTKIKETIKKFIEDKGYEKYNRLIILLLIEKKSYTATFDTQGKFSFNSETDILDNLDLIQEIRCKTVEEMEKISSFLSNELEVKTTVGEPTEAGEVETIIDLIEWITKNRKIIKPKDTIIDPDYKINKRFKAFAEKLIDEYTSLYTVYGDAVERVKNELFNDQAQQIITVLFLQDISVQILDKNENNPIKALNALVDYFQEKLSKNRKKYDRSAIKFYLVNELIKCNVFPNERCDDIENE